MSATLEVNAKETYPLGFSSTIREKINNHYQKVWYYTFCYIGGLKGGPNLEDIVKWYKQAVKSKRRIRINQ